MTRVSLELATSVTVAMGKDSGDRLVIETKRLPANVLEAIVTAGIKVILTNAYNGGGKDAKQADKLAAATKKLDAWYRGEFNVVARGDSMLTAMREAYIDDIRQKSDGALSVSDIEKSIKETVHSVFGEKESATFGKFLDALATLLSRENESEVAAERDALESYYLALADEAAKRRTASAAKIDVKGLALAGFLKTKK